MNQTMTYYPVRDFGTVRICCHRSECRTVTELPLVRVEEVLAKTKGCCPVCDKPFTLPNVEGGADVVTRLCKMVIAMNQLAGQVGIEFPLVAQQTPPSKGVGIL